MLLVFGLFLALVSSANGIACPIGYTQFNGNCYKLYNAYLTRDQAAIQCQKDSAILPTIRDSSTNQYLFNFARQVGSIFIGSTCTGDQVTTCRWEDLSDLSGYQNFYSDRPVSKFGNCVWMEENGHYYGEWASVDCANTTSAFVCQYFSGSNCNPVSTPTTIQPTTVTQTGSSGVNWPGYCNPGTVLYTPVTIFTPNWPNRYLPNYSCLWHIHSTSSAANITITDLNLGGGAKIEIYSDNTVGPVLRTITSNSFTPIYLTDPVYNPTIVFETTDDTPGTGFRATITAA